MSSPAPIDPPQPPSHTGIAGNDCYDIEIVDAQSRIDVDLDRLRKVAVDVLRHEGVTSASISVALIDGATMQALNRRHLDHDYDTDVLSFLLECTEPDTVAPALPRGAGKILDGEILISGDVTARAAAEAGWCAESEVTLYLVHGLLHLVGYDDQIESDRSTMRDRERVHLARWKLTPTY